jgi:hypothetical protein
MTSDQVLGKQLLDLARREEVWRERLARDDLEKRVAELEAWQERVRAYFLSK